MSSYVSVLNDEYKDVHVVLKNHFYAHFEQNQVQTGPKLTSSPKGGIFGNKLPDRV